MLNVKDFEIKKEYPTYQPTDDERVKLNFISTRFSAMKQARAVVDVDRPIYQTMIDAVLVPYGDERASSCVPLASAMIELYVAEATKISTEWIFKAETSKYSSGAKALEYVWKYDRRKMNRKREFINAEYIAAGFGTSIMYTGFESYTKKQRDMVISDDGKIDREEKEIEKSEIILKNIDIRDFYIDNQAIEGIEDASDCIYRQWVSYESFKNLEGNEFYSNVDKVTPTNFSTEDRTTTTQGDDMKGQGEFVKLLHYRNVEKDCYMVVANDVLVREHPMTSTINGEKALPFAVRVLGKKNWSIYGRGLCEALVNFNSDINNMRELRMDAIRKSNVSVLAIGSGVDFRGRDFSFDNEILTFDGQLDNSTFQQISGNPPNQALVSQLQEVMKEISVYVGIDVMNINGTPDQTAFQTEVQREASQKRINVWLTNRDLGYERVANLHKDNLQKYFPRKTADGLYPEIEIEGEEVVDENVTPEGEEPKKRFRKKKGMHTFEVTPEMLRGDKNIYVDVYTNTNAPTINAVDREQAQGFLTAVGAIVQSYALSKQSGYDLEPIMPFKQTVKDLAVKFNIQPQDAGSEDHKEVQEGKQKLIQDLMKMMPQGGGGGAMPPEGGAPAPEGAMPPEGMPPTGGEPPMPGAEPPIEGQPESPLPPSPTPGQPPMM